MGIISILLNSSVVMWVCAFVCVVFCLRCLIHGTLSGTSAVLRILLILLFACLAYYFYRHANLLHGSNIIDNFVRDSWIEFKQFIVFIKSQF